MKATFSFTLIIKYVTKRADGTIVLSRNLLEMCENSYENYNRKLC